MKVSELWGSYHSRKAHFWSWETEILPRNTKITYLCPQWAFISYVGLCGLGFQSWEVAPSIKCFTTLRYSELCSVQCSASLQRKDRHRKIFLTLSPRLYIMANHVNGAQRCQGHAWCNSPEKGASVRGHQGSQEKLAFVLVGWLLSLALPWPGKSQLILGMGQNKQTH